MTRSGTRERKGAWHNGNFSFNFIFSQTFIPSLLSWDRKKLFFTSVKAFSDFSQQLWELSHSLPCFDFIMMKIHWAPHRKEVELKSLLLLPRDFVSGNFCFAKNIFLVKIETLWIVRFLNLTCLRRPLWRWMLLLVYWECRLFWLT